MTFLRGAADGTPGWAGGDCGVVGMWHGSCVRVTTGATGIRHDRGRPARPVRTEVPPMHAVLGTCLLSRFVAIVLLAAPSALGAGHAHAGHLTTSERPCSGPSSCAPR
jgi:hypothetical protein